MGREMQENDGQIGRDSAASLIGWWIEAGVDCPAMDMPRGWLKGEEPRPTALAGPDETPAAPPATLEEFQAWVGSAQGLPMDRPGAVRVLPRGKASAPIMLMGDLPSADEAADGQPIGGQAWQLGQKMLQAIGVAPSEAYLASLSCFHSPGARFNGDLEACGKMAREHIRLAKPERLVLFGDAPARALLGEPLPRARGKIHKVEGVRTIATFHPRWLLQRPSDKALAWRDLLLLMEKDD
ncbi:uracil-DNA glycosylase [Sphingomonas xanthus]|uniref:Uracil-DNA glycosylase n=1 Tax=Sphingomonas xanthus TaxID=2594473 RepID=A0A516INS6_9SPHN|nr:uracil-DNA glycosylase [Sphingomonas xanthus]QDP18570.1 uracil-DNA glycosylase [Sphingomonas xanthus]